MADAKPVDALDRAKNDDAAARRRHADPEGRTRNTPYNEGGAAMKYGLIGGALMVAFQFAIYQSDAGKAIGLTAAGVLLLAPVLWWALREYREHLAGGEVFKNGMIHSLKISLTASLLMGGASIAIALLGRLPGDAEAAVDTPGMAFANGFFYILIGTAVGMIVAFILLQGMKSDQPADKNIEKVEGHA